MPASTTYTPLATVSGFSGSAQQLVISNIPQTYTDLVIVGSVRTTYSAVTTSYSIVLNNDFNSVYSNTNLNGTGTTATSGRGTNVNYGTTLEYAGASANATASVFGSSIIHIMNYSNTTTFKTVLMRGAVDNNGSGGLSLASGLYRSTNAIVQVMIQTNGNYVSGSTFTVYGIAAA